MSRQLCHPTRVVIALALLLCSGSLRRKKHLPAGPVEPVGESSSRVLSLLEARAL